MSDVTTWTCPQCGLAYDTVKPLDTIRAVRSFPNRYRRLFKALYREVLEADLVAHERPDDNTWSAVEYTAHVADMIDSMAPAIRRIVVEDDPTIPVFDHEAKVDDEGYNDLLVNEVLARLDSSCADMAMTLDCLGAEEWARVGEFPWGTRDALTVARNAVHEGSHHLRDIENGFADICGHPIGEGES